MPSPRELAGHAEAHAVEPLGARQLDRVRELQRGGVAGVVADHVAEQQRRVAHVARDRPGLVERGGERDHAVARDRAVGRFQPDDAAQRRRLADRAAGVGAERPRGQAGGDGGGAAAGGAAGHALAVPRVAHGAEGGVLVRGAHRELVLVGLREQRRAGLLQAPHDGGGVRRQVALEDPRARLAGHALGAEQVLDGQRHAAERRVGGRAAGGRSSATHVKQFSPSSPAARSAAARAR